LKTRKPSAWELGGTLFVPSTHKHLSSIGKGDKFPSLRSLVIDTEDGIQESDLKSGLQALEALLFNLPQTPCYRFIRPKNPRILKTILQMDGIEKMDGFVLPKFGMDNMESYIAELEGNSFAFMPSLEGHELFDTDSLKTIRNALLPFQSRIPLIRFGAEDMLKLLGLRRDCSLSLFDMSLPSQVIGNMMGVFKPYGFEISGGVYRCYQDHEGFLQDLLRDLREGLVSKTIIHPDQISIVEKCYQVTAEEYEEAKTLVEAEEAVFSLNGTMAEPQTQKRWAYNILARYDTYGMRP